jgi:hypothetical protein
MARIEAIELEHVLPTLPQITPLTNTPEQADLYLCALGFEPRCLAIPQRMAMEGRSIQMCRYIELNTNIADNRNNLRELQAALSVISQDVKSLNADTPAYERQLGLIISRLQAAIGRPPVVLFDISVAANRLLLRTFKLLLEAAVELHILYTEAAVYHPTREEFDADIEKWTSDEHIGTEIGVSSILPSSEYAGQHLDPLPNCIVLFPSFRKDRSLAVISKVDETLVTNPRDNVIWILGVPRAEANRWRTGAMKLINQIPDSAPQFDVTTFDYRDTLAVLERIYRDRWSKFNMTISPLGSKLQAIGTALFCYLHPDVKLLFAAPKQYNAAEWSNGSSQQWIISLGSTPVLRTELERIGTLAVVG